MSFNEKKTFMISTAIELKPQLYFKVFQGNFIYFNVQECFV